MRRLEARGIHHAQFSANVQLKQIASTTGYATRKKKIKQGGQGCLGANLTRTSDQLVERTRCDAVHLPRWYCV